MKKRTWIIISILVVLVIVVVLASLNFPPVFRESVLGTFGKADKYRKSQMTEKDIQLRSELTSDTAKLRTTIQGLVYFTLFTQDLSTQIDSCVTLFNRNGMVHQNDGSGLQALEDYSSFIKNNNATLEKTIVLLTGFYTGEQSDQSTDVEKNLRDFGNYYKNMQERDSVLNLALARMDDFLLKDKTIRAKKEQMLNLKAYRDQLLIKGMQLGGMFQDKILCSNMISNIILAQDNLNSALGSSQVQSNLKGGLLALGGMNKDQLGRLLGTGQINVSSELQFSNDLGSALNSKEGLNNNLGNSGQVNFNGLACYYSKENLQFFSIGQNGLGKGENLGQASPLFFLGSKGLNLCLAPLSFQGSGLSGTLSSFLNASQLALLGSDKLSLYNTGTLNMQDAFGNIIH